MRRLAKSALIQSLIRVTVLMFGCLGLFLSPVMVSAIEISDTPLESTVVGPPENVMLVLDNSGSMDWEFMTSEAEGLFQECFYLFPASAYQPTPDHRYDAGATLTASQRRHWRSQWSEYNRLYFDPRRTYAPWPATQRHFFEEADLNQPWSDPIHTGEGQARIDLCAEFLSIRSGGQVVRILNAHYFSHGDMNDNNIRDPGEAIYLVTWVDEDRDQRVDLGSAEGQDRRRYYRFVDDGDDCMEEGELRPVVTEAERNRIRPVVVNSQGQFIRHQTDRESLQNFANWCTYHRRRMLAVKATAAQVLSGLNNANAGLCAVNRGPRMGVRALNQQDGSGPNDNTRTLLDALYSMQAGGQTPLRGALDRVGRYFKGQERSGIRPSFDTGAVGGTCRRHVAVVISDGLWNGAFDGRGNADANSGSPYADAHADTLADVAAYYYNHDLAPSLDDGLQPWGCAEAAHQHMITMALSFGVNGTIDLSGYAGDPCLTEEGIPHFAWPLPEAQSGYENGRLPTTGSAGLLDDLLHATVNGRGRYYAMDEARLLRQDLEAWRPQDRRGSISNTVVVDSDQLNASSVLYRTGYDPSQWHGEVTAWEGADDPAPFGRLLWRASDQFQLPGLNWERRCVITSSGSSNQPSGIPFRFDQMSNAQQAILVDSFQSRDDSYQMARDLVAFIRGANVAGFRSRNNLLGDIVHSTPVVASGTLFVGANDGMLHAFDTQSGQERFAYVPTQLFGPLKALSDPGYGGQHRFYVDGPLWAGEVAVERYQRRSYLVGALGGGGRGYFCLLVGVGSRPRDGNGYSAYQWRFHVDQLGTPADESQAVQVVQWEYPPQDLTTDGVDNNDNGIVDEPGEMDPDIGYAFGQGYAVNVNCPNQGHRTVVIFGNGYNSKSQRAVLYVLDAESGDVIRKIDTGADLDNGLSTPALIDVNRDLRIDYAYAGDLNGNLWKFDLTAAEPHLWGVAYGEDRNNDNVINAVDGDHPLPLFQARGQPITGRPDIMAMAHSCNPLADGYMVFFGTGRYLSPGDLRDTSQQSIYAIWDYGDDADDNEHIGYLLDRSTGYLSSGLYLAPQTITGGGTNDGPRMRQVSGIPVFYPTREDPDSGQGADPARNVGWFLDFPMVPDPLADPGERVISRVILRNGKAVITSIVPQQHLCSSGGSSWVYLLDGCNGSPSESAGDQIPVAKQYAGRLLRPPVIIKDPSQPLLDRMVLPGPAESIHMETMKGEAWGQAYWWQNID